MTEHRGQKNAGDMSGSRLGTQPASGSYEPTPPLPARRPTGQRGEKSQVRSTEKRIAYPDKRKAERVPRQKNVFSLKYHF
jgi:hypothetical protein